MSKSKKKSKKNNKRNKTSKKCVCTDEAKRIISDIKYFKKHKLSEKKTT